MGKRGPSKTPQKILKLRGSWLAKTRNDLQNDGEKPKFPEYLGEPLRWVWDDIVAKLDRLGILDSIDQTMIAVYCVDFDDYWKAVRAVREDGTNIIITEKGIMKTSPLLEIKNQAHDRLVRTCSAFGMSPCARTGLAILTKNKEVSDKSKFFQKGS